MALAEALGPKILGLVIVDYGPDMDADGCNAILENFNRESRTYTSLTDYVNLLLDT